MKSSYLFGGGIECKALARTLCLAGLGFFFNSVALGDDLPDLAPFALQVPDPLSAPPNPAIAVVWGVTNQGTGSVAGYRWDVLYVSSRPVLDGVATYLGTFGEFNYLLAGESYWRTNQLQLSLTQGGQYYLILKADCYDNIAESNETNNVIAAPFTFNSTPADLVPLQLQVPADVTGPPNPPVTVAWEVVNLGSGTALNTWRDKLYLSSYSYIDDTAQAVGEWPATGPVEVGGSYWMTNTFRIPVTQSGFYYLILKTDDGDWLAESNPYNNELAMPVVFNIQPPDLVPVALVPPPSITAPPYPSVSIAWAVTNQGSGSAVGFPSWNDQLLFSTNNSPDNATLLGAWTEAGPVPAGVSYWRTNAVRLPVTRSGSGYLFIKADAYNNLVESDESNNLVGVPLSWTITPSDLVPITAPIPTVITGPPNPTLTLVWGVTNQGVGEALGSWENRVTLSTDTVPDWQDTWLDSFSLSQALAPGSSSWRTNVVGFPVLTNSTWYLIFRADLYDNVVEADESNNVVVVPVTFDIQPPDLVPLPPAPSLAITSSPMPSLTLTWGVTNQGTGPAVGNWSWKDFVYFSSDPVLDDRDPWVACEDQVGTVQPGTSYQWTNTCSLPVTQSGTYYLLFRTDAYAGVYESNETNNVAAMAVTCEVLHPDLAPILFQSPGAVTSPPNPNLAFVVGVTNQGAGSARGSWVDQIWISTNAEPDGTETLVSSFQRQGPIRPAQSYWAANSGAVFTNLVRVPVTASGSYFLFFKTDPLNEVYESNTNNNLAVLPVSFTIEPPDLAPLPLQVSTNITGPPYPTVTFVLGVTNQGVGAAVGYDYWSDTLYISSNAVFDSSAVYLAGQSETGPIAPGTAYWRTNTARLPVVKSGLYYFLFVTDYGNRLFESNETNNVVALPVTLTIQPSDLVPTLAAATAVTAPPNPVISIAWGVTNQGTGVAIPGPYPSWIDRVFYSTDATLDFSDALLSTTYGTYPLTPGAGYSGINWVRVPVVRSGTGYLIFKTDAEDTVFETNENNNLAKVQITFSIQPADLEPTALSVPSLVAGPPSPRLQISWGVTNRGPGAAVPVWYDRLYFSTNATLDWTASAIYTASEYGPVPAGAVYGRTNIARVPVTRSGAYYFIFAADYDNALCESNFVNNTLAVPVTFRVDPPDLAPVLLSAPASVTGPPNLTLTFSYGVTNQGDGAAIGIDSWSDRAFISTRPVLDGTEIPLSSGYSSSWRETGPVAAHRTYWRTRTAQVPVVTNGTYYLIVAANPDGELFESNLTNNVMATAITFNVRTPDLAPIALQAPDLASSGSSPFVRLVWGVTNQGAGPGPINSSWQDAVYLSRDGTIQPWDSPVATFPQAGPFPPGGCYWRTNTIRFPVADSGTYFLVLKVNSENSLVESDASNNLATVRVSFQVALPDLAPVALQAPVALTGPAYPEVALAWAVTNQGSGPAQPSGGYSDFWVDQVYLSTDAVLDPSDVAVACGYSSAPLAAGASYWQTNRVHLPVTQSGKYYLILSANDYRYLRESNPDNNVLAVPFAFDLTPPDLSPLSFAAPPSVTGPPHPIATLAWAVTNLGPGPAQDAYGSGWSDSIYLGTAPVRNGTESWVGMWTHPDALPVGDAYWVTNSAQLPVTQSGDYYLIFETDTWNTLLEPNFSNNVVSVPITVTINPPDLAPVALLALSSVTGAPYPTLQLVWGVTNQGAASTGASADWYDMVCITTNDTLPDPWWPAQVLVSHETNGLPAGGSYWRTNLLEMPVTESGTCYLWLVVDIYSQTFEANRSNNLVRVPISFQIRAPDLVPTTLLAPATVTASPDPSVTVVIGVTNQGSGPASGSRRWTDNLYLSTTPFLDQWPTPIATWVHSNDVAAGQSYRLTNTVRMPVIDSASYYLIFVTDSGNYLFESDVGNNQLMTTVTFELAPPADLAPTDLIVPPVVTGQGDQPIPVAWRVTNQGLGPADGSWNDRIYLVPAPGDHWYYGWPLLTQAETRSLPSGGGYWRTNQVSLAGFPNGNYYLVLEANFSREWYEGNWDDNEITAPVHVNFSVPSSPRINGGTFVPGSGFQLAVSGQLGTDYVLQASTNLANWVNVVAFTCSSLPTYVTDPQAGGFPRRFYRIAPASVLAPPALAISPTPTNTVVISWPLTGSDWVLEESTALTGAPSSWAPVTGPCQTSATRAWTTVAPAPGSRFYRLRLP